MERSGTRIERILNRFVKNVEKRFTTENLRPIVVEILFLIPHRREKKKIVTESGTNVHQSFSAGVQKKNQKKYLLLNH